MRQNPQAVGHLPGDRQFHRLIIDIYLFIDNLDPLPFRGDTSLDIIRASFSVIISGVAGEFENYNVSNQAIALISIGSEIFQVIGFFLALTIYYLLNKRSKLPSEIGAKGYLRYTFMDYSLKLYTIWSYIDWPLYHFG